MDKSSQLRGLQLIIVQFIPYGNFFRPFWLLIMIIGFLFKLYHLLTYCSVADSLSANIK